MNCFHDLCDQPIRNWPGTTWHFSNKTNSISAMIDGKFCLIDTADTTDLDSCTHNDYKNKSIKINYDRKAYNFFISSQSFCRSSPRRKSWSLNFSKSHFV